MALQRGRFNCLFSGDGQIGVQEALDGGWCQIALIPMVRIKEELFAVVIFLFSRNLLFSHTIPLLVRKIMFNTSSSGETKQKSPRIYPSHYTY